MWGGLVDGVVHSLGRTLSGVVDVATFWTADPADEDNKGIGFVLNAEHAWEQGEPHRIDEEGVMKGALKPVGKKLVRGGGDILFGVVELPGQIIKNTKQGALDLGIIKGVWYSASRIIDGAADIVTLLLPVPADNKGVAYDETRPWNALVDTVKEIF